MVVVIRNKMDVRTIDHVEIKIWTTDGKYYYKNFQERYMTVGRFSDWWNRFLLGMDK